MMASPWSRPIEGAGREILKCLDTNERACCAGEHRDIEHD